MMLFAAAVLLGVVPVQSSQTPPQAFRLESGDYRWVPFTVKQVPTEVDCRFEVLQGGPGVHVELLPMSEFRLFNRGRDHETLAVSPNARSGAFRRMIDRPGQYAVVVKNSADSPPAVISLELSTDLNPNASVVARELPARKRLTVILISFALFFTIVMWSGLRLMRALKRE
ncbi:MAG: hypothetical protein QOJ99_3844 [Bryobacterales bacterium]|jgi:hypothetical protein|nr:hypothetical protein [Bryobacterales bacterium]